MFDYNKAFSRNIGWVTQAEQDVLATKCVACAGCGGVGGEHLLTMARLGIQKFKIADFDDFEVHNFNRQSGAQMSTLGQDKAQVMANMIKDINPNAEVEIFSEGVTEENLDSFLKGVDLYIDGLDFFVLAIRRKVFAVCSALGIPAVTAAPLGMGTAFLCFMPGKMSFEDYFCLEGKDENEQYVRFLVGLSPALLQRPYLADPSTADFYAKKGPSTVMAVKLCAGVLGTYVLKILLGRGQVLAAPWGMHFDAYRNKFVKTWRPFGNRGLRQRFLIAVAKKIVLKD